MISLGIISALITPPPPPDSLSISAITTSGFTVSWVEPITYLTISYYNIYIDGILNGTSSTLSYNVINVTSNTTYAITVSTTDSSGNTSVLSSPISVTTLPIQPTAQVYALNFSLSASSASVSYNTTTVSFSLTATTTGNANIVLNKNGTDIDQYPDTIAANVNYVNSFTLTVAANYGDIYKINITYI